LAKARQVVLVSLTVDVSQGMEPFEIALAQEIVVGTDHEVHDLAAVLDPAGPTGTLKGVCFMVGLTQQSDDGAGATPQISAKHAPANDHRQRDEHPHRGGYCAHPVRIHGLGPRPDT